MIEEKHRVAALAALASREQIHELRLEDVWDRLEREGMIDGARLTESGYAFLRRSLSQT